MSGNLSHQIEHHLFPDLPSNRYAEIAPRVKDIFDRYGLTYHSAPLYKQVASAWHKVIRLSLPNGWLAETTPKNAPAQVVKLVRMTTGGKKVRRQLCRPRRLIARPLNRRGPEPSRFWASRRSLLRDRRSTRSARSGGPAVGPRRHRPGATRRRPASTPPSPRRGRRRLRRRSRPAPRRRTRSSPRPPASRRRGRRRGRGREPSWWRASSSCPENARPQPQPDPSGFLSSSAQTRPSRTSSPSIAWQKSPSRSPWRSRVAVSSFMREGCPTSTTVSEHLFGTLVSLHGQAVSTVA